MKKYLKSPALLFCLLPLFILSLAAMSTIHSQPFLLSVKSSMPYSTGKEDLASTLGKADEKAGKTGSTITKP